MKIVTAVSAVLLGIILAGGPSQLAVAQDPVQNQISHALAAVPGGVQTARNQVLWPNGTLLVVPDNDTALTTAASATCPSGRFCAHSQAAGAGARLEFSTCPSTNSVAALTAVRSISNARTSKTVTGRSGSTIVVTVAAGVTKNVTKTIDKLVCA